MRTMTNEAAAQHVAKFLTARRSVGPKHLTLPAPDAAALELAAAAARTAPCHGERFPVRFAVIENRERLADMFVSTLADDADEALRAKARSKAMKAPMQIAVLVDLTDTADERDRLERFTTAGAALMNFLHVLQGAGFAAKTVSGRAFKNTMGLFDAENEYLLAFIMCGTPDEAAQAELKTPRPDAEPIVSFWR